MPESIQENQPPEEFLQLGDFCARVEADCFFHGTGRFSTHYKDRDKSKATGEIVDVLASILERGLEPAADQIAILFLNKPRTTSLALERVYARCYGEIFGRDDGNAAQLAYSAIPREQAWKNFMDAHLRAIWRWENCKFLSRLARNLILRIPFSHWRKALNRKQQMGRWLANYGPIPGNYPCVIAVEKHFKPVVIPKGIDLFEVRCAEIISPEEFRAIEVPKARMRETQDLIRKLGLTIPVLPMEAAEASSWLAHMRVVRNADCDYGGDEDDARDCTFSKPRAE